MDRWPASALGSVRWNPNPPPGAKSLMVRHAERSAGILGD
jgi:hypothetical protein